MTMSDVDLVYLCSGFGISLLLHWISEAAYSFYHVFTEGD